jgi:hypothetical protein
LHHRGVCRHAENLTNVFTHPFCGLQVVQLNLNSDVSADDVQASGKTKDCREFSHTVTGEVGVVSDKLVFHSNRQ